MCGGVYFVFRLKSSPTEPFDPKDLAHKYPKDQALKNPKDQAHKYPKRSSPVPKLNVQI